MLLSIVIPFLNEEATLPPLMKEVLALTGNFEVILVDDGSTDGSARALAPFLEDERVRLVSHSPCRGKGYGIRQGLKHARGEYLIIKDADLEQDTGDIMRIWAEAQRGGWDAVFGSRVLAWPPVYDLRHTANLIMTLWVDMWAKGQLSDIMTGYKLVKISLLRSLELSSNGFDIEPEICVKLLKSQVAIKEIPIDYRPRTIAAGKKIRPRHFLTVIWATVKYRLR